MARSLCKHGGAARQHRVVGDLLLSMNREARRHWSPARHLLNCDSQTPWSTHKRRSVPSWWVRGGNFVMHAVSSGGSLVADSGGFRIPASPRGSRFLKEFRWSPRESATDVASHARGQRFGSLGELTLDARNGTTALVRPCG